MRKKPGRNTIIQGDTLEVLKTFPDECIDTVMTSPPYWAQRDYAVTGQLGLEQSFHEYIKKLCRIFSEVKRVLKKTGTCFVNLGDTYYGSGGAGGHYGEFLTEKKQFANYKQPKGKLLPAKCLCLIPFRFAVEMCKRGWILRNVIIFQKPNCMPSNVKDRFTVDFEYLFFFTKSKKYYFQTQYEPHKQSSIDRITSSPGTGSGLSFGTGNRRYARVKKLILNPQGRIKRSIWSIPAQPYKGAHFATYPEKLCRTPIQAGCPEQVCIKCGRPKAHPKCKCKAGFEPGIVLDPFIGSGTTAIVAKKLCRNYVGIDLSLEYAKMAEERIFNEAGLL